MDLSSQVPAVRVLVQVLVPSLTVTFPEGEPIAVSTVKLTVNLVFTLDGSGMWLVMVVVESALLTVCGTLTEVLG